MGSPANLISVAAVLRMVALERTLLQRDRTIELDLHLLNHRRHLHHDLLRHPSYY